MVAADTEATGELRSWLSNQMPETVVPIGAQTYLGRCLLGHVPPRDVTGHEIPRGRGTLNGQRESLFGCIRSARSALVHVREIRELEQCPVSLKDRSPAHSQTSTS
jgi:hypothetical protein